VSLLLLNKGELIMVSNIQQDDSQKTGAVLVIGGGVGGIQAALDLAESGYHVYLVEQSPAIGGVMAQLDKTFPTNDCSMCILSPKLVECGRHRNIEIITCADVLDVKGEPGNFSVLIRKRARFVDETLCTGCGDCTKNCPVRYIPQVKKRGNGPGKD
jgi:heterodisulfide reductase subunit A